MMMMMMMMMTMMMTMTTMSLARVPESVSKLSRTDYSVERLF